MNLPGLRSLVDDLVSALKHIDTNDLRWSWVINLALVPIGIIINIFFAHGWSVWPFMVVVGLLVMINESVDRGGEGFPPLQVYAFFISALAMYAIGLAIISALNVFVLFAAMSVIFYYSAKAYIKQRQDRRLIAQREADGQCIFCGEDLAPEAAYCENCGNEPAAAQRDRISAVMHNNQSGQRMREVLSKSSFAAAARKKEQSLIAKSFNRKRSSGRKR